MIAQRYFWSFFCILRCLAQPGSIVSIENLGTETIGKSFVSVSIARLTYLTTFKNSLLAAQTLVFSPTATTAKPFLLFYAHPTVGASCTCSIANNGTNQDKISNVPSLLDLISLGFTVVVPAYAGFVCPQVHPYLVGVVVASSILDAIRSVQFWRPHFYSSEFAGYGWSQGGHAVLWTQYLCPLYSPELTLLSASAIAPPTNLSALVTVNLKSLPGKYLSILGIWSWPTYYPSLSLSQLVSKKKIAVVEQLAQVCILTLHPEKNHKLLGLLALRTGWLVQDPSKDPQWRTLMDENIPPPYVASHTNLMVFQGKKDMLVSWNVTQAWVRSLSSPISFFLYNNLNHHSVIKTAMPIIIHQLTEMFQL